MKTTILKSMRMEKLLIFTLVTLVEFFVLPANAQVYRRKNTGQEPTKAVISITATMSTRGFTVKSDIDYLDGKRIGMQGWESQFSISGNKVGVRSGFGAFNTMLQEGSSAKLSSYSGLVNIYLKDIKSQLRPYAVTGLTVNATELKGTYIPDAPIIPSISKSKKCTCQTAMEDPDIALNSTLEEPAEPISIENTGKFTSTQLMTGIGAELNLLKPGKYFALFGEIRYGLLIGTTSQTASMNHTKAKTNVAFSFGAAIGLNGKKKIKYRSAYR